MNMSKKLPLFFLMAFSLIVLEGCSSSNEPTLTFEEKMRIEYAQNNRLDKFDELNERYDGSRVVLFLNRENDSWWITNFTGWFMSSIIDIPDIIGMGALLATFYIVAWAIGVSLTGGGILAVLAVIGTALGVIPGIPPAIMGIVYLAIVMMVVSGLFSMIW